MICFTNKHFLVLTGGPFWTKNSSSGGGGGSPLFGVVHQRRMGNPFHQRRFMLKLGQGHRR